MEREEERATSIRDYFKNKLDAERRAMLSEDKTGLRKRVKRMTKIDRRRYTLLIEEDDRRRKQRAAAKKLKALEKEREEMRAEEKLASNCRKVHRVFCRFKRCAWECLDDGNGNKYYQHKETYESQWDVPKKFARAPPKALIDPFPDDEDSDADYEVARAQSSKYEYPTAAQTWIECWDAESSVAYYYNSETGESTYEPPQDWQQESTWYDENNGYEDGEVEWQGGSIQESSEDYGQTEWQSETMQEYAGDVSAPEWQAYTDDNGYTYYYNSTTGESTYENPWEYYAGATISTNTTATTY